MQEQWTAIPPALIAESEQKKTHTFEDCFCTENFLLRPIIHPYLITLVLLEQMNQKYIDTHHIFQPLLHISVCDQASRRLSAEPLTRPRPPENSLYYYSSSLSQGLLHLPSS